MATSTTVAAFKTALVAALTTAINDATVQVTYGRPQDAMVRREAIFVADVDYSSAIANVKSGRKQIDEDYTVDVLFAVGKPRGTSTDCEARVFALYEFLRDVLAESSGATGLSVDGVWMAAVESVRAMTELQGEGPVSVIEATVRVRARVE